MERLEEGKICEPEKEERVLVKKKYGFLPKSVWNLNRRRGQKYLGDYKDDSKERTLKSSANKHLSDYRLSEFNPEVAKRIISYWSEEGDTIYDPFAGRSTRGLVSLNLNRNYCGCEITEGTYNLLVETLSRNQNNSLIEKESRYKVFHKDSTKTNTEMDTESADLVFTCPPYYDLEKYESCEGQLSDCLTYKEFLQQLEGAIIDSSRILKNKKFSVWVVADWRRNKKYYNFHGDLIELHEKHGFEIWDIVINELNSPFASLGAQQNADLKRTAKIHEYILVFRKNNEQKEKITSLEQLPTVEASPFQKSIEELNERVKRLEEKTENIKGSDA